MKLIKTKSYEIAVNESGDKNSSKIAILMPGRLDSKDYVNFASHAEYLAQKGFFVIAIDPPGTWDSPGELNNYTTSTYIKVINELINYFSNRTTLLLGHSRGGATAMLASGNTAVKGLVLVNAAYGPPSPPKPGEVKDGVLPEYRDLPPGNIRTKEQKRFDLPMVYFEDGGKHNPIDSLKIFKGPKLIVHATKDEFEKIEEIKEIYAGLSEPKMFLPIECTHDYRLYPEVIEAVNEKVGEFVGKFLANSITRP